MIQDIYPSKLDNVYRDQKPEADDFVLVFDKEGKVFVRIRDNEPEFTTAKQISCACPVFLFSIDDRGYFLTPYEAADIPEGFEACSVRSLRNNDSHGKGLFAAFTAYHLWKWYNDNRFCGCCGREMKHSVSERAMKCGCGNTVYPRINPAVIVGVMNGNSLLITRYRQGYGHNALIAGFVEIGETLEETVAREVSEEAGVRVKNIRYYKSQPWGMAQDLLAGFFCEVDGDDSIRMDEGELKYAQWVKREDIELQPGSLSLTNEMMKMFKEGKV